MRPKKLLLTISVYTAITAAAGCTTYFVLPTSVQNRLVYTATSGENGKEEQDNGSKFLTKLVKQVTDQGISGNLALKAQLPDNDSDSTTFNKISLTTQNLLFAMKQGEDEAGEKKTDIDLALNAQVDYNGTKLGLGVNFSTVGGAAYISVGNMISQTENLSQIDLKYKALSTDDFGGFEDVLGKILAKAMGYTDTSAMGSSWLLDTLLGSSDSKDASQKELSDSLSSGESAASSSAEAESSSGTSFSYDMKEEEGTNDFGGHTFNLTLNVEGGGTSLSPINIVLQSDSELNLRKATLGDITIGEGDKAISLSGISFETTALSGCRDAIKSLLPTNPEAYAPIVNTRGLLEDVYDVMDSKKFSLAIEGTYEDSYQYVEKSSQEETITAVTWPDSTGSDASSEATVTHKKTQDIALTGAVYADMEDEQYDVSLGASLNGKNKGIDVHYLSSSEAQKLRNLSDAAKYGDVLVSYNDYKYAMDGLGIDELLGQFADDSKKEDTDAKGTSVLDDLRNAGKSLGKFIKVLDSDGLHAIEDLRFEGILDAIKSFSSDSLGNIKLSLSLASFALGGEAALDLAINTASQNGDTVTIGAEKTIEASLSNIEIGDDKLKSLSLTLQGYPETAPYSLTAEEIAKYHYIEGLPTIAGQIKDIASDPKVSASFQVDVDKVSGSTATDYLLVEGTTAFDANQDSEKDANAKKGVGELKITENGVKVTDSNGNSVDKVHDIKLDVDPENVLLHYDSNQSSGALKDGEGINGSLSVDAVKSIGKQVIDLATDGKDRFSKFFSGAKEVAASDVLGNVMNGNLGALIEQGDLIQSMSLNEGKKEGATRAVATSSTIVLNGTSLGFDDGKDATLSVSYDADGKLSSLGLADLCTGGKKIGLTLNLTEYSDSQLASGKITKDSSFLDLESTKYLVRDAINSAQAEDYKLAGNVNVSILFSFLKAIDVDLAADVHVAGNKTYARVTGNVPLMMGINSDYTLKSGTRNTTIYYAPGRWGDSSNPSHLYVHNYDSYGGIWSKTKTEDLCYSENYFQGSNGGDHILKFILCDILNLSESTVQDKILNQEQKSSSTAMEFESLFSGGSFSFTGNADGTGAHSWGIAVNLGKLLGTNLLNTANITLGSNESGLLSSLSGKMSILDIVKANLDSFSCAYGNAISEADKTDYNNYISSYTGTVVTGE